jgi:hypothetical protein
MATVYEYKGVSYELPDGLTNEAALSRIKSSLSDVTQEATIAPEAAPAQATAPSITDQLKRQACLACRAVVH